MRTLFLVLLGAVAVAQDLRVGTAEIVITPPQGMPMAGYYSLRLLTGVHDDLKAKAIVIQTGSSKAAVVSCDLIGIPPTVIEEARGLVRAQTGIADVMISATHTHTGPMIPGGGFRDGVYGGSLPVVKQYREELPKKIAESVRVANERLTPARISFAKGREDSISFNRRFFMKDGTVGWNPGKLNPNIVRPAGPIDPDVSVVYFEGISDGKPLATYVNFALHLDTVGGTEASADYPATLAKTLAKLKDPGMVTVFTIGTAGNINHINVKSKEPQKGPEEAARIGTVLAGEVLKTYARLEGASGSVQAAKRAVALELPALNASDEERALAVAKRVDAKEQVPFLETVNAFKVLDVAGRKGKPWDAEVQVITLGDQIAWVGLPGEIFTELGTAIKQASPFPMTIVAELASGPVTYYPNEAAYPQGNYEVVTSRVGQGSGEKLVAAAKQMLRDMYPPNAQATAPKEKITLFNGKNLDGWYAWLQKTKYDDPKKVFSVVDGMIKISGEDWGGIATRQAYRDYHLVVEWKWGGPALGERATKARDSGILVHAVGEDGAHGGIWLESIESQIIEGGAGDFIMVGGKRNPTMTAEVREQGSEAYWQAGGKRVTKDRGRFDWYGRDPDWKDSLGFRGRQDVDNPVGEWNRQEVICDGDTIKNIVNGKIVNYGFDSSHSSGKIQIQSEGAEIWIRRVELLPVVH